MKRIISIVLSLICAASLIGCTEGKPVVDTENISLILCCGLPDAVEGIEVPPEDMAEMTDWLGGFTAGRPVGSQPLAPGSNSYWVVIEYGDGRQITFGLDATEVDGVTCHIEREPLPDCFLELFGGEDN